jgi:hypothetical protein
MLSITSSIDTHNLAFAFKLANEAVNLKHSNPIIKGLTLDDKETFI